MKQKEIDLTHLDTLIALFKSLYTGNENSVKTDQLLFEFAKLNIATSGQTIRHLIGMIRRNDLVAPGAILSDVSNGYWLSNDQAEMSAFIDKQMNRMSNQYQNIKALHQRIRMNKKAETEVQTQLFY